MGTRRNSSKFIFWIISIFIFLTLLCYLIGFDGVKNITSQILPDYYEKANTKNMLLKEKQTLIDENTALKNERSRLMTSNSVMKEEINVIRNMLEMDMYWNSYPDLEGETARIIFKDFYRLFTNILVDKGSDHGIELDMVALGQYGVVGRVIEVKPEYSRIRTIRSPRLAFGVLVERTRELGLITGGRNELMLEYLSINSHIALGDSIVTSGTTDITPAGLPVGIVKEVIRYEPEHRLSVKVESPENIDLLQSVWIVKSNRSINTGVLSEGVIGGAR